MKSPELRTVAYVENVSSFWCNLNDLDDNRSGYGSGAASSYTAAPASTATLASTNSSTHRDQESSTARSWSTNQEDEFATEHFSVVNPPPGLERNLDSWAPQQDVSTKASCNGQRQVKELRHPDQDTLDRVLDSFHINLGDLPLGSEAVGNARGEALVDQVFEELGSSIPRELLEAIDARGLLEKIPRNDQQLLTSIGSIGHNMDIQCRPCLFWFRGRCSKGILCEFCHFVHEGQRPKRIRAAKNTRLKMRDGEMPRAFSFLD